MSIQLLYEHGLRFTQQLHFSLFDSYICKHGCSFCYLRDSWKKSLVPVKPIDDIFYVLDHFYTCLQDDLTFVKRKYREQYDWYFSHADKFHSPSMTDNSFMPMSNLILKDGIKFKSICQITITPEFFSEEVFDRIKLLRSNYHIEQIKILIGDDKDYSGLVDKVKPYCRFVSVSSKLFSYIEVKNQITTNNYEFYNDDDYFNLSDSLYLYGNKFYLTLRDVTERNQDYCIPAENFNYYDFLYDILVQQQRKYVKYLELDIPDNLRSIITFMGKLKFNKDWTQIPYFMFDHQDIQPKVRALFNEDKYFFNRKDKVGKKLLVRG